MIDPDAEDVARRLDESEPDWLQVECTLAAPSSHGPADWPWQPFAGALERWRDEGRFEYFGFVRKPPGLRLRFAGPQIDDRVAPVLFAWLEEMAASDALRGFQRSTYEPEIHRFGGPKGMEIAHLHIDRDSALLARYEALLATGAGHGVARAEGSLAVLSDLASRCVDDGAEVWDVWMRLAGALGIAAAGATASSAERHHGAAALAPAWLETLSDEQRDLIDRWGQTHDEVATALRAADGLGELAIGRRRWVATACVFHWNRAGLDIQDVRENLASLIELWRPPEHRP